MHFDKTMHILSAVLKGKTRFCIYVQGKEGPCVVVEQKLAKIDR